MKFPALLTILALAIGIAIGWVAKPSSETPEANSAQSDPPKISNRKEPKTTPAPTTEETSEVTPSDRIVNGNSSDKASQDRKARVEKFQSQFGKMMQKNQQRKLDARIKQLVAQLNLTPEQEAALRKAIEENQLDPESLTPGNFDPSKLGDLTGDGTLNEALADILTDEQKEEYEALKERELANKIESNALKSLARLSSLDMTPEQKDAVYDILYKQAEESTTTESPVNTVFTAVTSGLGLNIDAADLGIDLGSMGQDLASGQTMNQSDMLERIRENQERQNDEKVDALRPVLNETQLTQYREILERPQRGIFGGFGAGRSEDK